MVHKSGALNVSPRTTRTTVPIPPPNTRRPPPDPRASSTFSLSLLPCQSIYPVSVHGIHSRLLNGADGISDIEGKATRVGASERGKRASFNSMRSQTAVAKEIHLRTDVTTSSRSSSAPALRAACPILPMQTARLSARSVSIENIFFLLP